MSSTPLICVLQRRGDGLLEHLGRGAGIDGAHGAPPAGRSPGTARSAARASRRGPRCTMKIDSTAAKIGRSMKKREIMASVPPATSSASGLASGFARPCRARRAARLLGSPTCTARPGTIFMSPSTITLSPAFRPAVMIQSSPTHSPDLHRARLGLALGADHVDELALRAFEHRALRHRDRVRAHRALERSRARTGRGAGRPSAFGNSARVSVVPVVPETRTSEKSSRPGLRVCACRPRSSPRPRTCRPSAASSRPAATSRLERACSVSEMPKFTYIGSICVTVVSSTSGPETSVPSLFSARPAMPETGDSTRV